MRTFSSIFRTVCAPLMCSVLYQYCARCDERGHAKDKCNTAGHRERFDRFKKFGWLTHTAKKEKDVWGFKPFVRSDAVKKTNKNFIVFSDTQQVVPLYEVELLCIVSYGKFPSAIKDTE